MRSPPRLPLLLTTKRMTTTWFFLLLVGTPASYAFSTSSSSTTDSTSHALITFDVDGTLVQGSGDADRSAHSRAFSHAVSTVFGRPVPPVAQVLPRHLFHGSTDGLILLRLAKMGLGIEVTESFPQLDRLMQVMYEFIQSMEDEEVANGIAVLPGVLSQLDTLARANNIHCGLVTGNVEGIARRKMKAVGIWDTQALSPPSPCQTKLWAGTESFGFLGGFGSDYCSGNIDDLQYNHLDRSKQIELAVQRCQHLSPVQKVVHVGDAPADVLAAKAYAERVAASPCGNNQICVGMIATATGSYSAQELQDSAGESMPGQWECTVLEDGMNDPNFIQACRVATSAASNNNSRASH